MTADDDHENGILGINPPNRVSPFMVDPSGNPILKIANGSIVGGVAGALTGMTLGAAYGIVKKFYNAIGKHDDTETAPVTEDVDPRISQTANVIGGMIGQAAGKTSPVLKDAYEHALREFYRSQDFLDAVDKIEWMKYNPDKVATVGIPTTIIAAALIKVAYDKWKNRQNS